VEYRVRYDRRCSNDADLAEAFHAERTNLLVVLVGEDDLYVLDVRMSRNMILC
jgi:hypothetical protein